MTAPLNPVAMWPEPKFSAARFALAGLYLDGDGKYRIYDAPHASDAGFETSGGITTVVPASTAPQRIVHFSTGVTRILP